MDLGKDERDLRGGHDHADEDIAILAARGGKKNVERPRDVEHGEVHQELTAARDGERRTMNLAPHGRHAEEKAQVPHCHPRMGISMPASTARRTPKAIWTSSSSSAR